MTGDLLSGAELWRVHEHVWTFDGRFPVDDTLPEVESVICECGATALRAGDLVYDEAEVGQ